MGTGIILSGIPPLDGMVVHVEFPNGAMWRVMVDEKAGHAHFVYVLPSTADAERDLSDKEAFVELNRIAKK